MPIHHQLGKDGTFKEIQEGSVLGSGSFGKVVAKTIVLKNGGSKFCACKTTSLECAEAMREVYLLSLLRDLPGVIQIHFAEHCFEGAKLFNTNMVARIYTDLLMCNLFELYKSFGKSFTSKLKFSLCQQLIHALSHMHERGICHRDIKLDNIGVKSSGNVCFIDFGAGRFIESQNQPLDVSPGMFSKQVQTLWWRSPEMLFSSMEDDGGFYCPFTLDCWALCSVLFQIWTFKRPFSNKDLLKRAPQNDYEMLLCVSKILGKPPFDKLDYMPNFKQNLKEFDAFRIPDVMMIIFQNTFHYNWKERISSHEMAMLLMVHNVSLSVEPFDEIGPFFCDQKSCRKSYKITPTQTSLMLLREFEQLPSQTFSKKRKCVETKESPEKLPKPNVVETQEKDCWEKVEKAERGQKCGSCKNPLRCKEHMKVKATGETKCMGCFCKPEWKMPNDL